MPSQITNYQCPACTGGLHFSSTTGKLECEYCGSSFTIEEIEALYKEKEEAAAQAQAHAEQAAKPDDVPPEYTNEEWNDDTMRAYNCPSCGAELICDNTTAATSCPYCGNPTVVPGQFHGTLKPDYIIPFKVDKNEAIAALKAHYKGRFLLPKVFSEENHINEIKGIYVPFWLYDADVEADIAYDATKTFSTTDGSWETITTNHYKVHRAGQMQFLNVPADSSSKMPDDYMDSIEPFDYRELKPFSTAYLPGFLADRYDVSQEDCAKRAGGRIRSSAESLMHAQVSGYQTVTATDKKINFTSQKIKYAMLPVWLLSTRWEGNTYLFAMNGQTGKLVGNLPIDRKKLYLTMAATAIGTAALLLLTGIAGGIASLFG